MEKAQEIDIDVVFGLNDCLKDDNAIEEEDVHYEEIKDVDLNEVAD